MRKSIFEIENRLNIDCEFRNFLKCLYEDYSIVYKSHYYNLWEFIDKYAFNLWQYRDTFIDLELYLTHIGISKEMLFQGSRIDEVSFLNFIEFLLNIKYVIDCNYDFPYICRSSRVKNIIDHNVPLILEKMNYVSYRKGDKILIRKRDSDVDSILELVPDDIQNLLLEYNDIRNNNLESKKSILKKIDLFIEKRKSVYKSLNSSTYDTIQVIVNKMGINHPLEEKPYVDITEEKLIDWYDKCFKLMIHLIRTEDINTINKERKELNL